MAFVDTITIHVTSGSGGDGCISFRREKFVAKGGPDGGDGGNGGNIILISSSKISTFLDLGNKQRYKAGNGEQGRAKKQSGKRGADCIITIPCGTVVYNSETGAILHDFTTDNEHVCLLTGGTGGKGNIHFATSRIQAPRKATKGTHGNTLILTLELKLIADVGFVGYPNAGKSTLLNTLTLANPKIGCYPFTTRHPNLGILHYYNTDIILADIPGIIDGASEGIGLGNKFLRHISRTNLLLFLLEPNQTDIDATIDDYLNLVEELLKYDEPLLRQKQWMVVLNKIDTLIDTDIERLKTSFSRHNIDLTTISCHSKTGIQPLSQRIFNYVKKANCH